ncbi:tyrosine-type recombinase/integrase [Actinacidiphila sp. bgisy167]|uniref:tyrosine-type recombinase/integrase n=1 Tax=Actinacidiphila sp. bgisy167 TaxID=3413797 RepID=UPI003D764C41
MVRDLSDTATLVSDASDEQMCPRSTVPVRRMLSRVRTAVRAGFSQYAGTGPAEEDLLDLRALGQRSRTPAGIRHSKTVDLRTVGQPWLRNLLRTWTIQQRPNADDFARTLWGVQLASQAMASRPGTDDPAKLRYDHVTAVVEAFRAALKQNGEPAGWSYRVSIASHFFALIDYGRRSGAVNDLSAAFVRDPAAHRIAQEEASEDEIGKAIPEPVIRQLDAHLHLLGQGRARGQRTLAPDDLQLMYQTLYVLLRDTGRRPNEIVSLPRKCLETRQDQTSLIWDNHKARRHRRRLPITASTAQATRTWRERRDQLQATLPPAGVDYLFPALTPLATRRHLHTSYLSETLRHWVDSLPVLHAEGSDSGGETLPFDRSLIYAYAFRHSYAQRHADAGTPLDVLSELMDHKSVRTTQRYYTVSMQRKHEAVAKLSAHRRPPGTACRATSCVLALAERHVALVPRIRRTAQTGTELRLSQISRPGSPANCAPPSRRDGDAASAPPPPQPSTPPSDQRSRQTPATSCCRCCMEDFSNDIEVSQFSRSRDAAISGGVPRHQGPCGAGHRGDDSEQALRRRQGRPRRASPEWIRRKRLPVPVDVQPRSSGEGDGLQGDRRSDPREGGPRQSCRRLSASQRRSH